MANIPNRFKHMPLVEILAERGLSYYWAARATGIKKDALRAMIRSGWDEVYLREVFSTAPEVLPKAEKPPKIEMAKEQEAPSMAARPIPKRRYDRAGGQPRSMRDLLQKLGIKDNPDALPDSFFSLKKGQQMRYLESAAIKQDALQARILKHLRRYGKITIPPEITSDAAARAEGFLNANSARVAFEAAKNIWEKEKIVVDSSHKMS